MLQRMGRQDYVLAGGSARTSSWQGSEGSAWPYQQRDDDGMPAGLCQANLEAQTQAGVRGGVNTAGYSRGRNTNEHDGSDDEGAMLEDELRNYHSRKGEGDTAFFGVSPATH